MTKVMNEKLAKYILVLNSIENIIQKYIQEQKEYIKCSKNCSYCCESGAFPTSKIEFSFVKQGISKLDPESRKKIKAKTIELYEKRHIHLQQGKDIFDFTYECPFLDKKKCLIYEYRPIICRIHGLMNYEQSEESSDSMKVNMPCCTEIGLNYAEVWDKEKKVVSEEKAKQLNKQIMPRVYPIGYSKMLDELNEIGHGEIRMLFEWVLLSIPKYEEIIEKIKAKH